MTRQPQKNTHTNPSRRRPFLPLWQSDDGSQWRKLLEYAQENPVTPLMAYTNTFGQNAPTWCPNVHGASGITIGLISED